MAMSNANTVRKFILDLKGSTFTLNDLPKVNNPHSVLYKLEGHGEIEPVGFTESANGGTKPMKVYREVNVRMRGARNDVERDDPMTNWKGVMPDWFVPPSFAGNRRVFNNWER